MKYPFFAVLLCLTAMITAEEFLLYPPGIRIEPHGKGDYHAQNALEHWTEGKFFRAKIGNHSFEIENF